MLNFQQIDNAIWNAPGNLAKWVGKTLKDFGSQTGPSKVMADVDEVVTDAEKNVIGKEKPYTAAKDVAKGVAGYMTPPDDASMTQGAGESPMETLERIGKFAKFVAVRGAESFAQPLKVTKDLVQTFGADVMNAPNVLGGAQDYLLGKPIRPEATQNAPGGMAERIQNAQGKYGGLTGTTLVAGQTALQGAGAAGLGMMAGQVKNAWDAKGQPMGGYVTDIQSQRARDPKSTIQELAQDHAEYHQQLGKSAEEPHMSDYHDLLADRLSDDLGLPRPVLKEDFQRVFGETKRMFPEYKMPAVEGKGPTRVVAGAPPITDRTSAESTALYRYENSRTYNVNDQFIDFKEGAIRDLRRLGTPESVVDAIRDLPRGGVGPGEFADKVLNDMMLPNGTELPDGAGSVLSAWDAEVGLAKDIHAGLRADGTFTRAPASPVADMEGTVFGITDSVGHSNAEVASVLRDTAQLYADRGDAVRAGAYKRAANILTGENAPDVSGFSSAKDIQDAFKGQGGIGKQMSSHIMDINESGSFPEYEALHAGPKGPGAEGFELGGAPVGKSPSPSSAASMTDLHAEQGVTGAERVGNNTAKITYDDGSVAYRLHKTDVITNNPDGTVTLDTGGWATSTTKDRMNTYLPEGYGVSQKQGVWSLVKDGEIVSEIGHDPLTFDPTSGKVMDPNIIVTSPNAPGGETIGGPVGKWEKTPVFGAGDKVRLSEDALVNHARSVPPELGYTTEQFAWRDTLRKLEGQNGEITDVFGKNANVTFDDGTTIQIDLKSLTPQGPGTFAGGPGAEGLVGPLKEVVGEDLLKELKDKGGFAYDVAHQRNLRGADVTIVSPYPEFTKPFPKGVDVTFGDLKAYTEKFAQILSEPGHEVGIYLEDSTGEYMMDVGIAVPNELKGVAEKMGKSFDQFSVYNMKTEQIVPTGGSGKGAEGMPPIEARIQMARDLLGESAIPKEVPKLSTLEPPSDFRGARR